MRIKRINSYQDPRFSQIVLNQHGAFLIESDPYEVEIISGFEALVRGRDKTVFSQLIEEFRFYAPHITRFLEDNGTILEEHPHPQLLTLFIEDIQPSQFYVDQDKIAAVGSFLDHADDIIIQVTPHDGRYISLDGHTRLYYAVLHGWTQVRAVETVCDECTFEFAEEAQKRGITSPKEIALVSHEEYDEKWNRFCDDFFAAKGSCQKTIVENTP